MQAATSGRRLGSRFSSRFFGVGFAALLCVFVSMRVLAETPLSSELQRSETLIVLTEEWPPVSFSGNGEATGMAVDVVREMLRRTGYKAEIEVVPWARGFKQVSEHPNVLLFSVARTPEREAVMTLIGPLLTARTEMYQRRGNVWKDRTGDELRQGVVGTYRASVFEKIARDNGFSRLELTVTADRSARMLLTGRIDLWIDSSVSAPAIMLVSGGSVADLETVLTLDVTELMLGVSRGTPAKVVYELENALHAMKADGSYQRIFRRWFPSETPPRHVVRVGVQPH